MKRVISEKYKPHEKEVCQLIENFNDKGEMLNDGDRNCIKVFSLGKKLVNVKSFKVPNAINKIAYRFVRKSKAERSFEYAETLLSKNIGTPYPVGYFEQKTTIAFLSSFYVSEQLNYDLTYRELIHQPDFPARESILKAFTRFTYDLHEKGIEFLDHSPGNTLIQLNNGDYQFFLVDLNRMNFKTMDFDSRMKNFARLTPKEEMVRIMAGEYAQLIKRPEKEVFDKMWFYTRDFQKKFIRKHKMKKKLKFWKS